MYSPISLPLPLPLSFHQQHVDPPRYEPLQDVENRRRRELRELQPQNEPFTYNFEFENGNYAERIRWPKRELDRNDHSKIALAIDELSKFIHDRKFPDGWNIDLKLRLTQQTKKRKQFRKEKEFEKSTEIETQKIGEKDQRKKWQNGRQREKEQKKPSAQRKQAQRDPPKQKCVAQKKRTNAQNRMPVEERTGQDIRDDPEVQEAFRKIRKMKLKGNIRESPKEPGWPDSESLGMEFESLELDSLESNKHAPHAPPPPKNSKAICVVKKSQKFPRSVSFDGQPRRWLDQK